MQYNYIVTSRDYIHNLSFHVLYSRQPIFICSIGSKAVDLIFQLWWAIVGGYENSDTTLQTSFKASKE